MIYISDIKLCPSFIALRGAISSDYKLVINTDSRSLSSDEAFLAISGDKFNAVDFVDQAVKAKSKIVIYTKNDKNDKIIEEFRDQITFIETTDSILFLQEITRILSDRFQDNGGKLIAISGSNGKTTTKEMLFHLLAGVEEETICTQKNNNNHIGVPLTLLQITDRTKFAIVELGSNHPGEIETLCRIVNPKYGVTTNIGDTHLEFFENRENVFKEEGYLHEAVNTCGKTGNIFFKNEDDEYLSRLSSSNDFSFGFNGKESKFNIDKEKVIVQNSMNEYAFSNRYITGQHNFYNLCVAFIVAQKLDPAHSEKFVALCDSFKPTTNRSEWVKINNTEIFLDAYNANPSSMRAAINGFLDKASSPYTLIIGDMNELGRDALYYHEQLGEELSSMKLENLIFVGKHAEDLAAKCKKSKTFADAIELKKYFKSTVLTSSKYVFIKGSRSLQLESILDITSP
jgi:UDP-N-acetylmuramoyl-tripeptide--D-alanyl-D-alanine ligase